MSCEHHHGAGEAPAAAFDSNLRTAHQRHSLAKARGPPNRQARGIRSALTRSSSAWRRLCCRPCRRPSLTPCDRGSRGPDPCWCAGAGGESADGFALPFRRPLKAISSPPRPRQSDAHRGPAMNTVGGDPSASITDRQALPMLGTASTTGLHPRERHQKRRCRPCTSRRSAGAPGGSGACWVSLQRAAGGSVRIRWWPRCRRRRPACRWPRPRTRWPTPAARRRRCPRHREP